MSYKIKVSYEEDQEIDDLMERLGWIDHKVKLCPMKGQYRRAYITRVSAPDKAWLAYTAANSSELEAWSKWNRLYEEYEACAPEDKEEVRGKLSKAAFVHKAAMERTAQALEYLKKVRTYV